ncbi:MAG: NADH-quinone oxidoreductase subunit N [Chloroflexota bacterium]|nr:MAG: NADH-quinone oxidoreductase subunit N [Chloroflexota bacterium]
MPIEFPTLNFAALAPILTVLGTAALVMICDLIFKDKRFLGYLSLFGLIIAAAPCFLMLMEAPPAPSFQNMAVSDGYSLVLDLIFIVTAALSVLVSLSYLDHKNMQRGEYYALLLFATSGMMLMGAATDLIIVFMGLEVMSIALYILAAFNRRQLASGEAGMKYFVLGAFASAFFLYGAAMLYGATGTTNLQAMGAWFSPERGNLRDPLALVGLGLLLVGFSFKVAAVPFQWWTPDVYHGAPTSVTAFMSVGAKAAGFAALIRVLMVSFSNAFTLDWQIAVAALAFITMTGGNIAALAQKDVKRMLAYSSIAHAGYILVGVAAGNTAGVTGVLFYLMAYAFMNIGAFAVITVLEQRNAIGTGFGDYAGLGMRKPLLALAMTFFMFSLTGIPPFVGFWGKLYVFGAAVQANLSWLAVAGMINSAISAFYYLAVVVQMYMRSAPADSGEAVPLHLNGPVTVTLALAALVTIVLGIWPTPLVNLTALGLFG